MNYQVLRRSTASLMNQLGIDGKTVADQLGHGVNVSQNVYTQAGIKLQRDAVNQLDAALRRRERLKHSERRTKALPQRQRAR